MKPSIIFVDDEPYLLDGLRRTMLSQRVNWDIHFVSSGDLALQLIESKPIDTIISDMRMPNMDGADLLEQVVKKRPGIVRIVLSGEADRALTFRTFGHSHRFLSKPINPTAIISTINDTLHLKRELSALISVDEATNLLRLTTPAAIQSEVSAAVQNSDTTVGTLVAIVKRDPALTAKFLQLVNSAYFGPAQQTWSVAVALRKLGLELVRDILKTKYFGAVEIPNQSVSQSDALRGCEDLALAKAASDLTLSLGHSPENAELAYNTGLLARIGRHVSFSDPQPAAVTYTMIAAYIACLIGLPRILYGALTRLTAIQEIYDPAEGARLIVHALTQADPSRSKALQYVG